MSGQEEKPPQFEQEMILEELSGPDASTRRKALLSIAESKNSTAEIVHALERAALFDPDPALRRDALRILQEPVHHAIHSKLSHLDERNRLAISKELGAWEKDGLISTETLNVLRGRLGFKTGPTVQPAIPSTPSTETPMPAPIVPTPAAPARQAAQQSIIGIVTPSASEAPSAPETPSALKTPSALETSLPVQAATARHRASLGSVLFSETTINVALYLGAFFVLAAAFIVAALVEVARLPILGVVTLAAFGGAAGLARRLKGASFILFIIGSVLVLIDANVVEQQFGIVRPGHWRDMDLYWSGVLFPSAVLWAAGGLWYRSRILMLGSYVALFIAAFRFDYGLDPAFPLIALVGLAGATASLFLQKKGLTRLHWPIFIASQLVQFGVLFLYFGILFFNDWLSHDPSMKPVDWLVQGGIWAVALLFYLLSDRILRKAKIDPFIILFPDIAATLSLAVFPLLLFSSISLTTQHQVLFIWVEAVVLNGLYKAMQAGRLPGWNHFSPYLATAGVMLFLAAAITAFGSTPVWSLAALAGAGLVYLLLVLWRFHMADWSLALVFLLAGYALAFYDDRLLGHYEIYTGYILLIPAVVFFGLWALTYRAEKDNLRWLPPLVLAVGLAFADINLSIDAFSPLETGSVFLVYALLLLVAAILVKAPPLAYGATSFLALAVLIFLFRQPARIPLYAIMALAGAYYAAGWRLPSSAALHPWRAVLRRSGAALAALCVFASMILEQNLPASASLALIAAISLVEALILPEIRLGYIATASLAGSLAFLAAHLQINTWSLPWIALAVIYSASGWYLRWREQESGYAKQTLREATQEGGQPPDAIQTSPVRRLANILLVGKLLEGKQLADTWQEVLRSSGWYLALLAAFISTDQSLPGAAIGFVVLAGISLVEASLRNQSQFGYVATASLAASLGLILVEISDVSWWQPYLVLASVYMLAGWGLTRMRQAIPAGMPAVLRWSGAIVATLVAFSGLISLNYLAASSGFTILGMMIIAEMLLQGRPVFGYAAATALAAALGSLLAHFEVQIWSLPLIALGGFYILVAWAMRRSPRLSSYAGAFTNSGMVLAGAASFMAPLQSAPVLVFVVAVAGALFALESIRQRNVWLGFPTGGVWFLAYITALKVINITEPQYFSIAAGALGVGMHYFLVRAGQQRAAVLTGLFSLLTILSTTFVQLVTVEDVQFFWLIFIQSLLLLGYGLWVRSRTFVVVPVIFSVLNVVVVTFSYLREFSTALTIGCTGVTLLLGAILALLARDRFQTAGGRIGQHLSRW